ncbi:MAG: ABC transporter permease [Sulfolobales archaeon]|nr:ABC transporter permease [Sulfolobales archaeon]
MNPILYDFLRQFRSWYNLLALVLFILALLGMGGLASLAVKTAISNSPLSGAGVFAVYNATTHKLFGYVFGADGELLEYRGTISLSNGSTVTVSGKGTLNLTLPPNVNTYPVVIDLNTSSGKVTASSPPGFGEETEYFFSTPSLINGESDLQIQLGSQFVYTAIVLTQGFNYGKPQKAIVMAINGKAEPATVVVSVQNLNVTVSGFKVFEVEAQPSLRFMISPVGQNATNATSAAHSAYLTATGYLTDLVPNLIVVLVYSLVILSGGFLIVNGLYPLATFYSTLNSIVRQTESGVLKFLIAQPITRTQILLVRYLSTALTVAVVAIIADSVSYAILYFTLSPFGFPVPRQLLFALFASTILIQMSYISLLYLIATFVNRGWQFSLISITTYAIFFLVLPTAINVIQNLQQASLTPEQSQLSNLPLEALYYLDFPSLGEQILINSVSFLEANIGWPEAVAGSLVWLVIPLALAIIRFRRKDF